MRFDLTVIGTGPAGQKAAVNGAKHGKRVAIIERASSVGGVCVQTGTIPSKALREAVLHLTGHRQRHFYGEGYSVKRTARMADLHRRTRFVIRREMDVIRSQMSRNGVRLMRGEATFVDAHTLRIRRGDEERIVTSDYVLLAVGSRPHRPANIEFLPGRVIDSDQILELNHLPRSLVVIGGGVIGVEYACMFAAIGVAVTLVDQRPRLLDFADAEIVEALQHQMRLMNVRLRLGEEVERVEAGEGDVQVALKSGKQIAAEVVLVAAGRQGNADALNLPAAGLAADNRGRVKVNEYYQTEVPHIFAAGDVIGFPSLAATAMEQGRLAASYMFGECWEAAAPIFPIGIYTIPEISMVGQTEAELTKSGVPYEAGLARYREIARGQLLGDTSGILKLLFHSDSRRLLGIHILGDGATELVHIGQTAMAAGLPIDYFVSSVFNYPTLAECYRVAALDGLNRVRPRKSKCSREVGKAARPPMIEAPVPAAC